MGQQKHDHDLIRRLIAEGMRNKDIVAQTGIGPSTVSQVRRGIESEKEWLESRRPSTWRRSNPWLGRYGDLPPLMAGLVAMLPDGGSLITESDLQRWLAAVQSAAHLVYNVVEDTPALDDAT